MNKVLVFLLIGALTIGIIGTALAQEENPSGTVAYPFGEYEKIAGQAKIEPAQVMLMAINWVFNIVLGVSIILVIYGGYLYSSSGGNPEKVKKAMNTIIYALIGVVIAIAAKAIINFVTQSLTGQQIPWPRGTQTNTKTNQ